MADAYTATRMLEAKQYFIISHLASQIDGGRGYILDCSGDRPLHWEGKKTDEPEQKLCAGSRKVEELSVKIHECNLKKSSGPGEMTTPVLGVRWEAEIK